MSTIIRRLEAGLTGVAAMAAATVLLAPSAHATVDSVTVSGTTHLINTEYTLTAQLSGASIGLLVYWSDNGENITGPKVPWPVGVSTINWTPTTKGQHIITAAQGGSTKTVIVNVVDPSEPTDPGGGTDPGTPGGTGSAGKLPSGLFGSS
ncbi:hypothetical protein [Nocardia arizonensis]|uniref:hypothetical protein n=1 Tax=Nocardia arizonensis TaxID=1141647 RepID=UPI0006D1748D|nr:hypothetical protein [Nocardia arizonensis]